MKGTRPLDNTEIRNLSLESGLKNRWQYTCRHTPTFLIPCNFIPHR